jgi:CheY-like chemotaxis protein
MHKKRLLFAGSDGSELGHIRETALLSGEMRVSSVRSAEDCIEKATAKHYDLILVEYDLGDRNGVQVVERLRALGVEAPMVVIVEEGQKARGIQAVRKGASDFIVKGTGFSWKLRSVVREFTGVHKTAEVKKTGARSSVNAMDLWAVSSAEQVAGKASERRGIPEPVEGLPGRVVEGAPEAKGFSGPPIDQFQLFRELNDVLLRYSREPLSMLLERIAEKACQVFRFHRATASMIDVEGHLFTRRVTIGYGPSPMKNIHNGTVPRRVIDQIFEERFQVRMVYRENEVRTLTDYFDAGRPERRSQRRRPTGQWEAGDVAVVRLADENRDTIGFISFDAPEDGLIGERNLFHNLELFGQWTSFAIAQHQRVYDLEKRSRSMERLLVTSNIFKLNLNLRELFNEIVWAIKFSTDFNLVGLGLISRNTGNLELKAVACDDKIKANRLLELQFPTGLLMEVFREEYRRSKSYLIQKPERVFRSYKQVYFGSALSERRLDGTRPAWTMLLVPIRTRESRTIGILIADDFTGSGMPGDEEIHTLEIVSKQFGIAIDNRSLYMKALRRLREPGTAKPEEELDFYENPTLAIKRMAERIFGRS